MLQTYIQLLEYHMISPNIQHSAHILIQLIGIFNVADSKYNVAR